LIHQILIHSLQSGDNMQRRDFLTKAAVGATVVGLAACGKKDEPKPAAATASAPVTTAPSAPVASGGSLPEVKWRLTSSFPKSLDTIYGGAEQLANRLRELTGGKFDIRVFPGGEIVPGLQALDAVQQGTVECCHTALTTTSARIAPSPSAPAFPFGMNSRQTNAWMYYGGGQQLLDEFYAGYNFISFPGGNSGTQMGGWWRKEVNTWPISRASRCVSAALVAPCCPSWRVPQQIAAGDIYPALEKGTIDAAEWIGPYDDEKLGFYKVAKNYYGPGWWEPINLPAVLRQQEGMGQAAQGIPGSLRRWPRPKPT
jgi:TRAP-type mannitol/chloroaromatic compound transport system substrate-binding protein